MERIERRLAEKTSRELRQRPLAFQVHPSKSDPILNDVLLSLDCESALNTTALDYEHWLHHYQDLLHTLADKYKHNERISFRISKALQKLNSELTSLTKVKVVEWKMQRRAFKKAIGSHLVDSRGFFMPLLGQGILTLQ